jgi:parallel beta-helix repeat protein
VRRRRGHRVARRPGALARTAHETPAVTVAFGRTLVVTSLRDFGPGTLRRALTLAKAGPPGVTATIGFRVTGTITLLRPLPAVYRPVIIDGTSAPAYRRGGPPVVAVNFSFRPGLRFASGSARSQLLGLAVDYAGGNGVTLNAPFITLNDDYVGLGLRGQPAGNRCDGVYVSPSSSGDLIGLNRAAAAGVVANVISGNRGNGLELYGSSGNTAVSNRIGTNPAGSRAVPNGGNGIVLTGRSDRNEVGGTAFVDKATGQANNPTGTKGTVPAVFVVPPLGNLVSGNRRNGVLINDGSRQNVLNGNFIGTTSDGDGRIGNLGNGVWIDRANDNQLIGCKFVNNPFVYYNVVSGNQENGLRITSANNSVVQGNFFGSGANNATTVRNGLDGILVDGSSGDTQVGGVIPLGNVSAGNGRNGIEVTGRAHGFTTFNTFGGLHAFGGAAPNGNDGVLITATGGDNLARANVMSGNRHNGIELAGDASGVTVDPDIAGLDTDGTGLLSNGGDGVLIDGSAHDNVIGGTLLTRTSFNRVVNNFIGLDRTGRRRLPNAGRPIVNLGWHNRIVANRT